MLLTDIYDNIPTFEELVPEYSFPKECDDYDGALLRNAPWLVEGQNLSLITSEGPLFLDAVLYHLIESLDGRYPIRVLLSKKTEQQFARELVAHMTGSDRYCPSEEMDRLRKRYDEAVEKIKSFDLKYIDIRDWMVEDLHHLEDGTDFTDAVVIFDSYVSLRTKATDSWALSRAVIGARLRDWLPDFRGLKSIIIFSQNLPELDRTEYYSSFDQFAHGHVALYDTEKRRVGNDLYYGIEAHLRSPERHGHTINLVVDAMTGRLYDTWPTDRGNSDPDNSAPDRSTSGEDTLF